LNRQTQTLELFGIKVDTLPADRAAAVLNAMDVAERASAALAGDRKALRPDEDVRVEASRSEHGPVDHTTFRFTADGTTLTLTVAENRVTGSLFYRLDYSDGDGEVHGTQVESSDHRPVIQLEPNRAAADRLIDRLEAGINLHRVEVSKREDAVPGMAQTLQEELRRTLGEDASVSVDQRGIFYRFNVRYMEDHVVHAPRVGYIGQEMHFPEQKDVWVASFNVETGEVISAEQMKKDFNKDAIESEDPIGFALALIDGALIVRSLTRGLIEAGLNRVGSRVTDDAIEAALNRVGSRVTDDAIEGGSGALLKTASRAEAGGVEAGAASGVREAIGAEAEALEDTRTWTAELLGQGGAAESRGLEGLAQGASRAQRVQAAVRDAQEAGFMRGISPGTVDLAVYPYRDAKAVKGALQLSGREFEAAHVAPTAALKGVTGPARRDALATTLARDGHLAMDHIWKKSLRALRREGQTELQAGELHNHVANAIQQAPGIEKRTRDAMEWVLYNDLFIERGLEWSSKVRLPYPKRY
jgi:hypothetical protein